MRGDDRGERPSKASGRAWAETLLLLHLVCGSWPAPNGDLREILRTDLRIFWSANPVFFPLPDYGVSFRQIAVAGIGHGKME